MTRMIAKAYRMADAVRAAGVPVVMGGPHVTEMPDEALGPRWRSTPCRRYSPRGSGRDLAEDRRDAVRGQLKDVYAPVDDFGQERKPTLQPYPTIPWNTINLDQFNIVPKPAYRWLKKVGSGVGNVSHHSGRVGARMPLWVRVLHRDRIFRRFDPVSH